MKRLKDIILFPFWRLWARFERGTKILDEKPHFVVLGFPRSGTSLVSRILASAGIGFGNENKFKRADRRNPKGFFEYADAIRLDEKLIKQSGFSFPYGFDDNASLRAQGMFNRFRRLLTRRKMISILCDIAGSGDRWAIKEFPLTFYFWEPYMPHTKIIGVYRDPIANAHSVHKSFRRHTFRQAIEQWTKANKELIYHLSTKESILIKLEDLSDKNKKEAILKQLVSFLGTGSVKTMLEIVGAVSHNEKSVAGKVSQIYPLNQETKDVLAALENLKIRI